MQRVDHLLERGLATTAMIECDQVITPGSIAMQRGPNAFRNTRPDSKCFLPSSSKSLLAQELACFIISPGTESIA